MAFKLEATQDRLQEAKKRNVQDISGETDERRLPMANASNQKTDVTN
jgi:hypothetical protein